MKKLTTASLALALILVCTPVFGTADCYLNFGEARLSTGINASATSIVLTSGAGATFSACDGQQFNLVIWNSTDYPDPARDPNVEIVRVTSRTTDTLTVTRAQESTTAKTHNTAGKTYRVMNAVTKALLDTIAAGSVPSVFGRTGAITAQSGDYSAFYALISHTHAESDVTGLVSDLAGKQATGNYITALTGDVTASGPGSVAGTLATVNSNTGSFGDATHIPSFTVNGKGLITAASSNTVVFPSNTTATSNQFFTAYTAATGAFTKAQPAFTDISGTASTGQIPSLAASKITSGTLALNVGGTNADLSATGGTSKFLRQNSVGAAVTVVQLAVADLSDANTLPTLAGANAFTGANTVKMGTGTGTASVDGTYAKFVSGSGVGNGADTTDDALWSLTAIPANSFTANGDALHLVLTLKTGATANNKHFGVTVGGTSVTTANSAVSNNTIIGFVTITRVDATHVNVAVAATASPTVIQAGSSMNLAVSDLTANTLAVVVTGASPTTGAANDVVLYSGAARWIK